MLSSPFHATEIAYKIHEAIESSRLRVEDDNEYHNLTDQEKTRRKLTSKRKRDAASVEVLYSADIKINTLQQK